MNAEKYLMLLGIALRDLEFSIVSFINGVYDVCFYHTYDH